MAALPARSRSTELLPASRRQEKAADWADLPNLIFYWKKDKAESVEIVAAGLGRRTFQCVLFVQKSRTLLKAIHACFGINLHIFSYTLLLARQIPAAMANGETIFLQTNLQSFP